MGSVRVAFLAGFVLAASFGAGCTSAQAGTTVYTTYSVGKTYLAWETCGSTPQSTGCYGSGTLNSFGRICAVLQGVPVVSGQTTRQKIYVLDSNSSHKNDVYLRVIDETVVTSASNITTTFSFAGRVALGLAGGDTVSCSAAANASVIAAGTSASTQAVLINKKNLALSTIGGFSPPLNITSIVADSNGYIAVNQGNSLFTAFTLLDPNGSLVEDGGGNAVVFNSNNAYVPH